MPGWRQARRQSRFRAKNGTGRTSTARLASCDGRSTRRRPKVCSATRKLPIVANARNPAGDAGAGPARLHRGRSDPDQSRIARARGFVRGRRLVAHRRLVHVTLSGVIPDSGKRLARRTIAGRERTVPRDSRRRFGIRITALAVERCRHAAKSVRHTAARDLLQLFGQSR